jgi:pantoate--beta-alanine ligase
MPRILASVADVRKWRRSLAPSTTVGFVPTMGALHDGHLGLAQVASEHCDVVLASIFVNPSQFENKEDLIKYPRTLDGDVALLSRKNVAMVFAPEVEEMYPATQERVVTLNVDGANALAEGSKRPGFFNAVATVVARLLNIVQPHKAFFGQKDAQQCATIRQMVRDLDVPVEIVIGPTRREPDGLAMSSRNVRITKEDRRYAKVIFQALSAGEFAIRAGERSPEAVRRIVCDVLATEPRFKVEYVSVASAISMKEVTGALPADHVPQSICISTAGILGPVRLIDNVLV